MRSYYIACIVAFAPVCLLAMQSLHQVRVLDLLLVGDCSRGILRRKELSSVK